MLTLLSKFYRKYRWYFLPTLNIKSVIWGGLLRELDNQFKRLTPGLVLDVGGREAPYRNMVPHTAYLRLDCDESAKPDILASAEAMPVFNEVIDTVVCIEVLEHVHRPQAVAEEIYRVLKPGGTCILSTRFIHPYHPGPEDYYRFSSAALKDLFHQFSEVEVIPQGNRLQMFYQFINLRTAEHPFWAVVTDVIASVLNILNPIVSRITHKDNFPLGFIVYAKK